MPAVIIYNEAYRIKVESSFLAQLIQGNYKLVKKLGTYLIFEAKHRKPCQDDESLDSFGQQ